MSQEFQRFAAFRPGGRAVQDNVECFCNDLGIHCRRLAGLFRDLPLDSARHVQAQLAVRQSQRLVRHDAFVSLEALVRIGFVEDLQESNLHIRCVLEINAPPVRFESFAGLDLQSAHRRIELSGNG